MLKSDRSVLETWAATHRARFPLANMKRLLSKFKQHLWINSPFSALDCIATVKKNKGRLIEDRLELSCDSHWTKNRIKTRVDIKCFGSHCFLAFSSSVCYKV